MASNFDNDGKKIPSTEGSYRDKFNRLFEPSTKDMVAYIMLIIGIILLFFSPIYGGLLIGIVAGVYYSKEIIETIRNSNAVIEELGITRSLILAGILLAFLISAPSIFVGTAVVVGLRWFVFSENE